MVRNIVRLEHKGGKSNFQNFTGDEKENLNCQYKSQCNY